MPLIHRKKSQMLAVICKYSAIYFLMIPVFLNCRGPAKDLSSEVKINPPDLAEIVSKCDSLQALGLYQDAARLYFYCNKGFESPQIYICAAELYAVAYIQDSALISVDLAINHGMSNPKILSKLGMENFGLNTALRSKIDQKLDSIARKISQLDNFEIITDPIESFWPYFNAAIADTANAKSYLSDFILNGSAAVKDYYLIRYRNTDKMYRQMILKTPDLYRYTEGALIDDHLDSITGKAYQLMHKLSDIYPLAVFPKVYLVPGLANSCGTYTNLGLYVAGEMYVKSENMPITGLTDWQKNNISGTEWMTLAIYHELLHFQQSYHDGKNSSTLIGKIIYEGACDFLVVLLSDSTGILPIRRNNLQYLADPVNMQFVLEELKREMYRRDLKNWMYNGGYIKDRPADLGYAIGYKICESYYQRSEDKKAAIFQLLNTGNFEGIIAGSEYGKVLQNE
jgi:hypothetical protein